MKKLLTTILTLTAIIISSQVFAKTNNNPLAKFDSQKIILTYLEVISQGKTDYSKYLFTNDFQYTFANTNKSYNRTQYLDFLKLNKGYIFDCTTHFEILDQTGNSAIAKATMTFGKFKRVDHITIIQTSDGWKVSKVVTNYS